MARIITISREFGSGGREIGKRLADVLGIPYYDQEIIEEISKRTGYAEEYIKKISEKGITPYAIHLATSFSRYTSLENTQMEIIVAEQKVLKAIAKKGDAIIVGRVANEVLKNYNPMNIFVYADMKSKIKRCREKKPEEQYTDKQLEKKIKKIDKDRKEYYELISNNKWGDKTSYDLCINTSNVQIKSIIYPIARYIDNWFDSNE